MRCSAGGATTLAIISHAAEGLPEGCICLTHMSEATAVLSVTAQMGAGCRDSSGGCCGAEPVRSQLPPPGTKA